ncbi:MAG: hypothetical protein QXR64_02520 [Pyrobaculum sp.]
MDRERIIRPLLFFLPTLVFIIALTAPGGEYAFRAGPVAEVSPGVLPTYASAVDKVLYLYSSPFGPWHYPQALVVKIFYPTFVYVSSTCGAVVVYTVGGAPGEYKIDITIPPGFQGDCFVNFTHPSGWEDYVILKVKLIDWYPGASERALIYLNGTGWQFVQVASDGILYIWEIPKGRLQFSGCVFVYNRSVLLSETQRYVEIIPNVLPKVQAPSDQGVERYGVFIRLTSQEPLYMYRLKCIDSLNATPPAPPPIRAIMGVLLPGREGPFFDTPTVETSAMYRTSLRSINYTVARGQVYRLYMYTYNTAVGLLGAVLRYQFSVSTLLTTEVSLFRPMGAVEIDKIRDAWVYSVGDTRYWVYSSKPPYYLCNPPCGVPAGWIDPIYLVIDPTGEWKGVAELIDVKYEILRPWGP